MDPILKLVSGLQNLSLRRWPTIAELPKKFYFLKMLKHFPSLK